MKAQKLQEIQQQEIADQNASQDSSINDDIIQEHQQQQNSLQLTVQIPSQQQSSLQNHIKFEVPESKSPIQKKKLTYSQIKDVQNLKHEFLDQEDYILKLKKHKPHEAGFRKFVSQMMLSNKQKQETIFKLNDKLNDLILSDACINTVQDDFENEDMLLGQFNNTIQTVQDNNQNKSISQQQLSISKLQLQQHQMQQQQKGLNDSQYSFFSIGQTQAGTLFESKDLENLSKLNHNQYKNNIHLSKAQRLQYSTMSFYQKTFFNETVESNKLQKLQQLYEDINRKQFLQNEITDSLVNKINENKQTINKFKGLIQELNNIEMRFDKKYVEMNDKIEETNMNKQTITNQMSMINYYLNNTLKERDQQIDTLKQEFTDDQLEIENMLNEYMENHQKLENLQEENQENQQQIRELDEDFQQKMDRQKDLTLILPTLDVMNILAQFFINSETIKYDLDAVIDEEKIVQLGIQQKLFNKRWNEFQKKLLAFDSKYAQQQINEFYITHNNDILNLAEKILTFFQEQTLWQAMLTTRHDDLIQQKQKLTLSQGNIQESFKEIITSSEQFKLQNEVQKLQQQQSQLYRQSTQLYIASSFTTNNLMRMNIEQIEMGKIQEIEKTKLNQNFLFKCFLFLIELIFRETSTIMSIYKMQKHLTKIDSDQRTFYKQAYTLYEFSKDFANAKDQDSIDAEKTTKQVEIKQYFLSLYPEESKMAEKFCMIIAHDDMFNFFTNTDQILKFMSNSFEFTKPKPVLSYFEKLKRNLAQLQSQALELFNNSLEQILQKICKLYQILMNVKKFNKSLLEEKKEKGVNSLQEDEQNAEEKKKFQRKMQKMYEEGYIPKEVRIKDINKKCEQFNQYFGRKKTLDLQSKGREQRKSRKNSKFVTMNTNLRSESKLLMKSSKDSLLLDDDQLNEKNGNLKQQNKERFGGGENDSDKEVHIDAISSQLKMQIKQQDEIRKNLQNNLKKDNKSILSLQNMNYLSLSNREQLKQQMWKDIYIIEKQIMKTMRDSDTNNENNYLSQQEKLQQFKMNNHLFKKQLTSRSDKKKLQEKPHLTLDNMLIKKQFSLFTPGTTAERTSIINQTNNNLINLEEGRGGVNANTNKNEEEQIFGLTSQNPLKSQKSQTARHLSSNKNSGNFFSSQSSQKQLLNKKSSKNLTSNDDQLNMRSSLFKNMSKRQVITEESTTQEQDNFSKKGQKQQLQQLSEMPQNTNGNRFQQPQKKKTKNSKSMASNEDIKLVPLKIKQIKNTQQKYKKQQKKQILRYSLPKDMEYNYEYLNVPQPKKMLYLAPLDQMIQSQSSGFSKPFPIVNFSKSPQELQLNQMIEEYRQNNEDIKQN